MALVKIDKLKGVALDYAVAVARKRTIKRDPMGFGFTSPNGGYWVWEESAARYGSGYQRIGTDYSPSTSPGLGATIIWDHRVSLNKRHDGWWVAWIFNINDEGKHMSIDDAPLVAGLRTYLKSIYGDEVEVPDEVLNYGKH